MLKKCICDVADKRYDKAQGHTPLGVALCRNRRAALRARVVHARGAGCGSGDDTPVPLEGEPACAIELPLRSDDKWGSSV